MLKLTKNVVLTIGLTAAMLFGANAAIADPFSGPHQVLVYKHQRYIAVPLGYGVGKNLFFYRARGGLWQEWGSTQIRKGQKKSNGSIRQNIWFKGRRGGYVDANLRSEFDLFRGEQIAR